MTGVMTLYRSSIGKKAVMALTGLIMVGYVVIHMWGNLKIFSGAAALNQYAEDLRYLGAPVLGTYQAIWLARVVLLAAVLLHIWSAVTLWQRSNAGRPTGYKEVRRTQPAYTYAAYTMRWGGIVIALFIVFHILHLTIGTGSWAYSGSFMHPEGGEYFAYQNVVGGFQVWYISLFYIVTMIFLGAHLYHGTWSMFQTVGWNKTGSTSNLLRTIAFLVAAAVVVGNIAIPLAVMTGLVGQV